MSTSGASWLQERAAIETLQGAGWVLAAPAAARLQLVSVRELAGLLGVEIKKAQRLARDPAYFARCIDLPGGDLRLYLADVERFLSRREVQGMPVADRRIAA